MPGLSRRPSKPRTHWRASCGAAARRLRPTPRAVPVAERRHHRRGHGGSRLRRARRARGVPARQGRGAPQRRARRHDRPHPAREGPRARGHHVRVRRRRTRRPDEPGPLGPGPGARAAGRRQREGSAGPVPEPNDPTGVRRALGSESRDGHQLRRRDEGELRADDRRQRDRLPGAPARHVAGPGVQGAARSAAGAIPADPRRDPRDRGDHRLHGRNDRDEGLRSRRAPSTPAAAVPRPVPHGPRAAVRVLDALPPGPLRGPERDRRGFASSGTSWRHRWADRSSRCARSPSAISSEARRSTSSATT